MAPPRVIWVTLTDEEAEKVRRPIKAEKDGGFQALAKRFKRRLRADNRLEVFPQDLEQAKAYCAKYGNGGYQARFQAVIQACVRAGQHGDF